ncbi:MAG: T9SS type A sorting domain-containing protein [Saprospiraceae bacterium]|nr:T9SS type A sorting domain-containing protein [Saprospiraceae bacterium]
MKKKRLFLSFAAVLLVVAVFISSKNGQDEQFYVPRNANAIEQNGIHGAVEYYKLLRNDPITGELDPALYIQTRKAVEKFSRETKASLNLTWTDIGPDNVGGRTRSILIDKNDPNIMFAGSVSGGLWKSTTAGSSWFQLDSITKSLPVCCMAQDKNGTIYVGTGESFTSATGTANTTVGSIGKGIFMSTNGTDFIQMPGTTPTVANNINVAWAFVSELACDPITARVYAATNVGLKYTDDGGANWVVAHNTVRCDEVQVASDGTVIASIANQCYLSPNGNTGTYVKKSSNNGTDLPTTNSSGAVGRIEFAFSPTDPNYVYASLASSSGDLFGIFRSVDKGNTWSLIGPPGSTNFQPFSNQGSYDNIIKVFPNNKDKILLGGVNLWTWTYGGSWTQVSLSSADPDGPYYKYYIHADHHAYTFHPTNPNIIFSGSDGGVSRSIDGGITWHTRNINYNTVQFFTLAVGFDGRVMGGTQDNGTIAVERKGPFPYHGKDVQGGDGGYCAFSHIKPDVYFSSVYFGGIKRSADAGANLYDFMSARMELLGTPGRDWPSPFVTPILFWESINDPNSHDTLLWVADTNYAVGTTLTLLSKTALYPFKHTLTTQIYKDDVVEAIDPVQSKYFLGGIGQLWMTRQALDFSKTPDWFKIGSFNGTTQTMSITKDGDVLFLGTSNGNLYRFSNLGASYDSLNTDIATGNSVIIQKQLNINSGGRAITNIAIDPSNPNHAIVTLGTFSSSPHIYRTTNALDTSSSGPTFVSKQGNLTSTLPVYGAVIRMNNSNTVIIGTEFGVFATDNIQAGNPTWTPENDGLALVPVHSIKQQTYNFPYVSHSFVKDGETFTLTFPQTQNTGAIYVGTHGRGFFENTKWMSIDEPKTNGIVSVNSNLVVYPNPVVNNTNVSYTLQNSSKVLIDVYSITGKLMKRVNLAQMPSGTHKYNLDCSEFANGTYIVQMITGETKATAKIIVQK